jgi:hypothetical protein
VHILRLFQGLWLLLLERFLKVPRFPCRFDRYSIGAVRGLRCRRRQAPDRGPPKRQHHSAVGAPSAVRLGVGGRSSRTEEIHPSEGPYFQMEAASPTSTGPCV